MKRRPALVALVAAALVLPLGGCASWWPWSDKARIPELPQLVANSARVVWSVSLRKGGTGYQPAVVGNDVFVAAGDGTVMKVDGVNGAVAWQARSEKGVTTGVGSDGQLTAVADRQGTLLAFDANGRLSWSTTTGAAVTSVPEVGHGLVVVLTSDSRVQAFDAVSGQRRWVFSRQNPPLVLRQNVAVAIDATTVYVGLPGGRLLGLALENGAVRWEAAVAVPKGSNEIERIADVLGKPLLVGREVCAATFLGKVACFDGTTGRTQWSRDIQAVGGLDGDERLVVAADDGGFVHGLSAGGAPLWREERLARRMLSAPLLLADAVAVGDITGIVHLLGRADGALVGRVTTDGSAIIAQPVRVGELAVVQTSAGGLYAIAAR
ncbi:MAG: outer membrane protein assembly factor BamB [Burkholderiaceae bacterium]|nr:outer membrane protein assembly factor BamB [Burkholderiaceae bacterium]